MPPRGDASSCKIAVNDKKGRQEVAIRKASVELALSISPQTAGIVVNAPDASSGGRYASAELGTERHEDYSEGFRSSCISRNARRHGCSGGLRCLVHVQLLPGRGELSGERHGGSLDVHRE